MSFDEWNSSEQSIRKYHMPVNAWFIVPLVLHKLNTQYEALTNSLGADR